MVLVRLTKRIASLMDTRTYKIALQLGHMVLVVVWHSLPGWWMMLWTDHHTALWPWRGKCGWHNDNISNLGNLTPDMVLPLHMNEIKLVHPRYLAPKTPLYRLSITGEVFWWFLLSD